MKTVRGSSLMRQMEARFGESMDTLLPRLFAKYGNATDVRRELDGISHNTLKNWIAWIGRELDTTSRLKKKDPA